MNIHPFLLSLGTASFLAFPASTAIFANTDSAERPGRAVADTTGMTRSTAFSVVPSPGGNSPPAIYFPAFEEQRAPAEEREQDRNRVMQAVVSPHGVPAGIVFSDPETETENTRTTLPGPAPEEPVVNVVIAANSGIPAGINIAARDDSQMPGDVGAIEYGAADRRIDDPLDFVQNASALFEYEIRNADGERLGTVHDFIIDKESGRVELVAAGSGDDLRLIPPQALEPVAGETHVILDLETDRWEEAPATSREDLHQLALEHDAREVYEFYGLRYRPAIARAEPAADSRSETAETETVEEEARAEVAAADSRGPALRNPRLQQSHRGTDRTPQQPFLADEEETEFGAAEREAAVAETEERTFWAGEILGQPVAAESEPIGEVADLIVDLHVGYLQHVIVSRSSGDAQSYALPLHDLEVTEGEGIRLLRDPATLDEAPEFDARMARLRRYEPFRYDTEEIPQYGAPNRAAETETPESGSGTDE